MKQETFQSAHRAEWDRYARWLERDAKKEAQRVFLPDDRPLDAQDFPAAYRRLCQQLAIAERRGYSEQLLVELRSLVQRGHVLLYQPPKPRLRRALDFFAADFPRLVRAQGGALAVSTLLLLVPAVGFTLLLHARPELVYTLCSQHTLDMFREMYSATPHEPATETARDSSRLVMFAYYIYNNVSIGFRTIASGLFACIGAVFVLVGNGVLFGAIAGYLDNIGEGPQFWRFVVGHSGLELTAIVIAGAGGLRLGMAILAPGRRTRARALVEAGKEAALLALGIFAMLIAAAFVEAFWSAQPDIPDPVKYGVGALVWLLVGLWLWRGGRGAAVASSGNGV
jgi:uncharacterized membrane protein SpoIIM required for sporulation